MRDKVKIGICKFLPLLLLLVGASCSTTKRLEDGKVLYTGVSKITMESTTDQSIPGYVKSAAEKPLMVKPNNPLWSPYVRTGIPIGLWVYNGWYSEKESGFKHWIYRKLAKEPVLISGLKLDVRMKMVEDILDNLGHFNSSAEYEIVSKRNPKKARMSYNIKVGKGWVYSNIEYPKMRSTFGEEIIASRSASLIEVGEQYNIDTLMAERARIANHMRRKNYYYFRPEYIEYKADTTKSAYGVDLHMTLSSATPPAALKPYKIGNVNVALHSSTGKGEADSTVYEGINIWYQKPLKIRRKILKRALRVRPGGRSNVSDMNRTLTNLNQLAIFRYVNLEVTPLDSLKGSDSMDLTINAAFDAPMQAEFEVDFSQKSNSFIGPGASFELRHNNIFHGGEELALKLNGGYEWQTGNRSESANATAINSYEFGVTTSLTYPRIIAPKFISGEQKSRSRTSFSLGVSIMNRPKFFKILELNFSTVYDFKTSRRSSHTLTPFKLVYSNLLSRTDHFKELMEENKAIEKSFENQFIPSLSYTYTYNRRVGRRYRDNVVWQSTFTSAGNLFQGIYSMVGQTGEKKLFGAPFSQFVKATTEVKYYKKIGSKSVLATRFLIGASHAYGNSSVVPYGEQFYIGGANSIRAFTIRSIGPGKYRPNEDELYGYFDQTGTFKIEANVEFRFPIIGGLYGAIFLDAGNIWLLSEDKDRPGGKFKIKNLFNELATGTGVGLRFDVSVLVIRADLGIGIHNPYKGVKRKGYYNIDKFKDGLGFHFAVGLPF